MQLLPDLQCLMSANGDDENSMVIQKPSILVYVNHPDAGSLREICAGIEEEGVLFTVESREETDLYQLAALAAQNSMLGSGIGVVGKDVGLQMTNLERAKNPFFFSEASKIQCRRLGANSARIVKKKPLKD